MKTRNINREIESTRKGQTSAYAQKFNFRIHKSTANEKMSFLLDPLSMMNHLNMKSFTWTLDLNPDLVHHQTVIN